jgi:hypothetical protein
VELRITLARFRTDPLLNSPAGVDGRARIEPGSADLRCVAEGDLGGLTHSAAAALWGAGAAMKWTVSCASSLLSASRVGSTGDLKISGTSRSCGQLVRARISGEIAWLLAPRPAARAARVIDRTAASRTAAGSGLSGIGWGHEAINSARRSEGVVVVVVVLRYLAAITLAACEHDRGNAPREIYHTAGMDEREFTRLQSARAPSRTPNSARQHGPALGYGNLNVISPSHCPDHAPGEPL